MMLIDSTERDSATDPLTSFIVQAPAGSGKTEILTQRYLRLLGTVAAPEQIVALTFTRKAANEMRERILVALQQVASGITATSQHQQKTFTFAAEALARDARLNWQLLQQPHRLRVITIDSLCQTLTQAIPLQAQQLHFAKVSDKPQSLYLDAARACLTYATTEPAFQPAIKILLHHLDNRQEALLSLFSALLTKRDQWVTLVYQAREQNIATYEQGLKWIQQHALTRFKDSLPLELADNLVTLIHQFVHIVGEPYDESSLHDLHDLSQLTNAQITHLTDLLLTTQNTLRKAFDHHVGLKRGACRPQDYNDLKTTSKNLFAQLSELPDFLDALIRIKNLPNPHYDSDQWETLQALFTLLPLLVAHLNLSFNEHNRVDFTAIAQQALLALGDELAPTDLALYMDSSISHILVDEFQDTSLLQFQLLQQLVQGWQPNDGRTLFVVGDPMQSIYRFRAAEVGLFLRTQEQGIGPVRLTPLELSCNFRSTKTIVNWVNDQFKHIFPCSNDIESGAVKFHASSTPPRHSDDEPDTYIKAFQYETRVQEAKALVQIIVNELHTYPNENIAILVRSRGQLRDIIHLLRQENIPFQGVDMDLLANLPHLRDVWSLTQALLMPANRLAWLALLRSPWCGLDISDLHCIAHYAKSQSIFYALEHLDKIAELSDEGRIRARYIHSVMHTALAKRHQQSLVEWITQTLVELHLNHTLDNAQQDDLEQYWLLLEQFERDGLIEDLTLFKAELTRLYSKQVTPARLQIMTIHKSKGLEFDCVILPGLGTKSANLDTPLLRWLKLPTQKGTLLLLSPMKAAHHEECALYDYLGQLDAEKNHYEQQRLLYVATTRAKKRLYLFDTRLNVRQGTFRHFLQHQTFDEAIKDDNAENPEIATLPLPLLYRLPIDLYMDSKNTIQSTQALPTLTNNSNPRLIGIVAHELLQWICDHHPTHFNEIPWDLALHQFRCLGFTGEELEAAHATIHQQLLHLFNDPIGQWIIKKHDNERNEYSLLTHHQDEMVTRVIDRTFNEDGIRWIIDFKTGHENTNSEKHYGQQVNEYARLLNERSPQTTHCGLYYLASGRWVTWCYQSLENSNVVIA